MSKAWKNVRCLVIPVSAPKGSRIFQYRQFDHHNWVHGTERESCNRLRAEASDGNFSEEYVGFQDPLRKAHHEYRRRFTEQQAALEDGQFVRAIAAATGRMPGVKRLEVQDFDDSAEHRISADQHAIQLPIAIHKAGTSIPGFWVEVSPTENFYALAPTREQRHDISAAVQQLKCFTFRPVGRSTKQEPVREPREFKAIEKYIKLFADTAALQHLSIWTEELWQVTPTVSLGPVINARPWPNLRFAGWIGLSLYLTELERGLENLSQTVLSLIIKDMHLLSGNWVEALDILRRKRPRSLTRPLEFETPSGAECEGMSQEAYEVVFKTDFINSVDTSLAERYIRGSID
ncbi:uncharacterized protein PAC_13641 [Phialocephala subalpina]|uniref:Uncharacterized protein n=1 Tax=Phialocephala subalpina TaxID=576137 RepID=A0A1L7XFD8_9HELO|nr:uncharacterized protein PAC_13641 [Phialocephala subalpina]